ncbi:MAG: class I SAM-dependent methyltransferase [Patescibacteria group bacterium]
MNLIKERVREFYNRTPFPDYELERFPTREALTARAYSFAKVLDRSIPVQASILDAGTGTGQLSTFLSLRRSCVYGIDFSDSSLNKARALKEQLKLDSLTLKKVDLLDQRQIDDIGVKFDYIICVGVLHHTADPYLGFANLLRLLKPDGYIAVGLYNTYGRIPLKIRKFLLHYVFRNDERMKEKFIKIQIHDLDDKERVRGWTNDQYYHPHESTHSIAEILRWFKKNNIRFLQTVPSTGEKQNLDLMGVFQQEPYPGVLKRFTAQLSWMSEDDPNGGYWITFGKRDTIK